MKFILPQKNSQRQAQFVLFFACQKRRIIVPDILQSMSSPLEKQKREQSALCGKKI